MAAVRLGDAVAFGDAVTFGDPMAFGAVVAVGDGDGDVATAAGLLRHQRGWGGPKGGECGVGYGVM